MIKRGTVKEWLTVDSVSRKMAGLCPLMLEETHGFQGSGSFFLVLLTYRG
ncbi:hypothetical protein PVAP13_3KG035100 [Panicum virgatum]|uniref:Uncharacterized protein n=1 Tax=Panicum virgatum TaxID=38727 RepID=A0A8T0UGG6_PANVG|nr:hypothetical protein PVAP13_3KG035100 [Panicum virgatum]